MKRAKEALVLILAGGVGSRLGILVQKRTKPAVPFGGIYRIIDFSLSNVMNSGLKKVGILTQYKPLSLMGHIGMGDAWDFTGRNREVRILPPRTGEKESDWYHGTADAVRRNIDFMESNPSEEVIILSGDHIYNMDFDAMIEYHRSKKADVTIAMMVMPKSKIHEFGTGIVDDKGRIIDWEEKPRIPRTNLASMGIYVFNYTYLLDTLFHDRTEVDFGMHILPRVIAEDDVFAYPFHGYWRDVGTIRSYWDANIDILTNRDISPQKWQIRTNIEAKGRAADRASARFGPNCHLDNSMVSAGCIIQGSVINSVLSPGVMVEEGAEVRDSIVFKDCIVRRGATVDLSILDKKVDIGEGAIVGHGGNFEIVNRLSPSQLSTGITLIGKGAKVPEDQKIGRNCAIDGNIKETDYPGEIVADGESLLVADDDF